MNTFIIYFRIKSFRFLEALCSKIKLSDGNNLLLYFATLILLFIQIFFSAVPMACGSSGAMDQTCDLRHSSDHAGSFTHWAAPRELVVSQCSRLKDAFPFRPSRWSWNVAFLAQQPLRSLLFLQHLIWPSCCDIAFSVEYRLKQVSLSSFLSWCPRGPAP